MQRVLEDLAGRGLHAAHLGATLYGVDSIIARDTATYCLRAVAFLLEIKRMEKPHTISRFGTRTAMAKVAKSIDSSSLAEVVDRILDKGIVIDAWLKVSLVGIELLSVEARIVIASVETYLKYAEAIGLTASAAAPA